MGLFSGDKAREAGEIFFEGRTGSFFSLAKQAVISERNTINWANNFFQEVTKA